MRLGLADEPPHRQGYWLRVHWQKRREAAQNCLWIQDVVAELVQLAERIVKVSDAPGGADIC